MNKLFLFTSLLITICVGAQNNPPTIESQPSLITVNAVPENLDINDLNIITNDDDGDNVTLTSTVSQFDCNNISFLQNSVRYGNGGVNTLGAGNVQTFKSVNNGFLTKLEVEFRGNTSATTQAVIEIYQNNNADPNLATDVELIGTVTLNIPAQFNALGEGEFDKPVYLEQNRMYVFRQISGPGIRMRQGSFYTAGATFTHDFNNPLVVNESAGFNNDWKFFVTQFNTSGITPTSVPVTANDGSNNTNANVDVYHFSKVAPSVIAQNISVDLDANGNANISPQQIDNGSSVACDGNMNLSLDITSFDCSSIGDNTVILTVEDDYGNTSTASAVVTVKDNAAPTFSTQSNVNINSTGSTEIVNYSLPTITDNCIGNAISFENYPATPSGFTKMGVFNGHTYFISNATDTYANFINTINTIDGAYPVSISSATENSFIANYLSENAQLSALIGLNDLETEGTFVWENGENVSYTNWITGEPNDSGGEDIGEIYDGEWNDISNSANYNPIIIEFSYAAEQTAGLASGSNFPIGTTTNTFEVNDESGNINTTSFDVIVNDTGNPDITCPDDITTTATNPTVNFNDPIVTDNSTSSFNFLPGMTFIGDNDGKNFFISNETYSGASAFADAVARGGFVATVNNASLNSFLANALSSNGISNAHIGYSDAASEGSFVWQDGSSSTYTNWQSGEPSNTNGIEDYVAISAGGSWNDVGAFGTGNLRYILQLNQDDGYVLQTSGPESGSSFPIGTTTVTFDAFDATGNNASCSFNITVTDIPTVNTQNIFVNLDSSGNASITPQDIDNGSSSVSGIASLSVNQTNFDCDDIVAFPSSTSLNFEGNGHIEIDGSSPLDFGGSKGFTFEAQIHPRSNANTYVLSKTLGGASWPNKLTTIVFINANNQLTFGINRFTNGGWTYLNSPLNSISLNEWQHVAVSYDPPSSTMKIYIKGAEVASTTLNTINPDASPGILKIGASENGSNQFDGYMEDFRAWENALDSTEMAAVKNNITSGVDNNLLLHYSFDTNFGNASVDLSTTQRNGTFTGGLSDSSWYTGANNLNPDGVTVTLTVTNNSGATATGTAIVTVLDNQAPELIVSNDINVNTTGTEEIVSYTAPTISDNCSGSNISLDNYPATPSGFTKMGVFNGHTYFVSDSQDSFTNFSSQVDNIQDAYFATITDVNENTFLANYLDNNSIGNAYIGLNDKQAEGNYVWETGEAVNYTNWSTGNPSNSGVGGEDVGELFPTGEWNDLPENLIRYAIIEFPYAVEQTAGLASGSNFPLGTTVNTFEAYDESGNTTTSSFDVTVTEIPTVDTQNVVVNLDSSGNASITPQDIDNGSSSVSGIASLSVNQTNFDCDDIVAFPSSTSLNFEGNGHIEIDGSSPLDFGGSKGFTFEAQIHPRSNANTYVLSKTLGGASWPNKLTTIVFINANNQLTFGINRFTNGGWTYLNSPLNSISLNEWQHVAVSYDPPSSTMKIYIKGAEVASTTLNTINPDASPGILKIGASENGSNQFDGYMEDFRAWENALDSTEMAAVKNNITSGVDNNLLLHYSFDTNFGNASVDLSTTQRNGTFTGGLSDSSWYTGANNLNPDGVTVTLTVASNSGESATGTAIVTVVDNLGPIVGTSPSNINEYTTNTSGTAVSYNLPNTFDACIPSQNLDDYPLTPSGYTKMGVFNGHTYFVSNQSYEDIQDHLDDIDLIADAYPIAINSAAENTFIASQISALGLSNVLLGAIRTSPTEFEWINGEPFTFTNWAPNEPNNTSGVEDKIEMNAALWNDAGATPLDRKIIVEFPYAVEQKAGLASGEIFPSGTTTNEFTVYDKSGNSTDLSFDVDLIQADYIYLNDAWLDAKNPNGNSTATETMLVIDNEASLTSPISLAELSIENNAAVSVNDVLSINSNFTNNGHITFKSSATSNGQFDTFTGTYTGTGTVEVERFIPVQTEDTRAFRFLTSAVDSNDPIYDNWQEGGNSPAGFGTHITGSDTGANGFDQTLTGNPSMYTFDNSFIGNQGNAWNAIPNTDNINLLAGEAYRMFIRGDRNYNLSSDPANAPNTDVTLRATGDLVIGSYTHTLSSVANYYSLVGNPYQAVVDFKSLTTSNVNTNNYYVWDPNISARGAYVTHNLTTGLNDLVSSATNEFIMPGQSFFVQTINISPGPVSLEFTESAKNVNAAQTTIFSDVTPSYMNLLLYKSQDLNNAENESDGIILIFDDNGNNSVDLMDATKLGNPDENLARFNNGQYLSIEERTSPADGEVLELYSAGYSVTDYTFSLNTDHINEDISVYLIDNYTGDQTLMNGDSNQYSFTVDASIPGSIATDRFSIEFEVETFGIDDNELADLKVYPNPVVDGKVTVQAPSISGDAKITLYNMMGQEVMIREANFQSIEVELNIGSHQAGVYFLEINQDGISAKQRLIIK